MLQFPIDGCSEIPSPSYVSFQSVAKEAQRLFFEIRIWDAGEVVRAVQQGYEHLSEDVQADLPLKRIWVIAEQE
jgi:restriction system protein